MTPKERAAREGDPAAVHVLLPNMSYACGGNILTKAGTSRCGAWKWDEITCPDCRAHGQEPLQREVYRQQGLEWPGDVLPAPDPHAVAASEEVALW